MTAFRANPENYASALRVVEHRGEWAIALSMRPREPKPGDLTRFAIQVAPAAEGAMNPSSASALRFVSGQAYLYLVDRNANQRPEVFQLHGTAEEGTYGFSKLIAKPGPYRVFFIARIQVGENEDTGEVLSKEIRIGLDWATEGVSARDEHHEDDSKPAKEHSGHAHPSEAAGSDRLSMRDQHDTMRHLGEHWLSIGETLSSDRPAYVEIESRISKITRLQDNLAGFELHKFADQKPEFLKYAAELERLVAAFGESVRSRRLEEARSRYAQIESQSCVKCHLKFQWGVVEDLSRYPDLRRMEYAHDRK